MIKLIIIPILLFAVLFSIKYLVKFIQQSSKSDFSDLADTVSRKIADYSINEYNARKAQTDKSVIVDIIDDIFGESMQGILPDADFKTKINTYSSRNCTYVITDDNDHPFQITKKNEQLTFLLTKGLTGEIEKAKAIYDWFMKEVKYGDSKRGKGKNVGYRHANEVFHDREGVCGEMAILYVVMARCAGLKANYVSVRVDYKGKDVHHACAVVRSSYRSDIFVDTAYYTFDIKHKRFNILGDEEAMIHFKQWR